MAAISDRVGLVLVAGSKLKDWRSSERAARSTVDAAGFAQQMIDFYRPDVLVVEKVETSSKGESARRIIWAMAMIGEQNGLLDVSVERPRDYANKYEEAEALAKRHPSIGPWVPRKRRFFEAEPRAMVIFEALALADTVARGGADRLAAEM